MWAAPASPWNPSIKEARVWKESEETFGVELRRGCNKKKRQKAGGKKSRGLKKKLNMWLCEERKMEAWGNEDENTWEGKVRKNSIIKIPRTMCILCGILTLFYARVLHCWCPELNFGALFDLSMTPLSVLFACNSSWPKDLQRRISVCQLLLRDSVPGTK